MAVPLRRLHHVSLHVSNGQNLVYDLVSKYKFNLFATRLTAKSKQVAFRKGATVFVVNERQNQNGMGLNEGLLGALDKYSIEQRRDDVGKHTYGTSSACLYDISPHHPVDSVSSVCFEVEDVERSFKVLRHLGCNFLVPPTTVEDENGLVTYSVVKSGVGNVCHTLIDKTKYGGIFLPGFNVTERGWSLEEEDASCPVTHFDHVTYACPRNSTHQVMKWYEKMFGFKRFFIDSNEDVDEGFVVNQEGVGLRLTAMQYWKCSKVGITLPFVDKKEPDCKFVIAESLPQQGRNQVDTFLEEHKGPGIQHIALYTENIVSTAQTMAAAGVQFFSPPPAYYTEATLVTHGDQFNSVKETEQNYHHILYRKRLMNWSVEVGKQQEIEEAGHKPQMLAQHGILLDTDLHQDPSSLTASSDDRRYLLQVFTKPIFAEDTFFLELIQRRGATGFGEGNIRALWRSVQAYMENERVDSQGDGSPKNVQTARY